MIAQERPLPSVGFSCFNFGKLNLSGWRGAGAGKTAVSVSQTAHCE